MEPKLSRVGSRRQRTEVSGCNLTISLVACTPSPSGIEQSMRTIRGLSSATICTALTPLSASPTTGDAICVFNKAPKSALILKYRARGKVPRWASFCYSSRILHMAKFFNGGIEKIVYEPPVRNRIGWPKAGTVYTSPAWSMNVVYARLKPFGAFSTLLLNLILGTFRVSAWLLYQFSRGNSARTP